MAKRASDTRHNHKDFDTIMLEVIATMPRRKQLFSKVIHSRALSSVSDLLARTIMRPNALLFGAIASFVFTLGTYLLSKNLGYSLSGSESILAFFVGWLAGIIFDATNAFLKRR